MVNSSDNSNPSDEAAKAVVQEVDGDSLLMDADGLFRVAEEFFELPVEEKVMYDFKSRGSYFGYKVRFPWTSMCALVGFSCDT